MKLSNKRLVVCCDGTWKEPKEKVPVDPANEPEPTNVLKVVRGIAPVDRNGIHQVVYYNRGVGTGRYVDKVIGGITGRGIDEDIQDAYRFIANNYHCGDELFLFGFSRGAYAVRSLAGLIDAVGLLSKADLACVPEAYAVYRLSPGKRAGSASQRRLKQYCREIRHGIPIKFIGVWDTVGALGVPIALGSRFTRSRVSFHNTQLGKHVRNAYHAMAIDERRRPFAPDLWTGTPAAHQTITQVWFSGVHNNIGGGYDNTVLSNITLGWMTDRASENGLEFAKSIFAIKREPAEKGRVENSFSFIYRALRKLGVTPYIREIGPCQHGDIRCPSSDVPGESVHPSAQAAIGKRFIGNPESTCYEPVNALRALHDRLPVWEVIRSPKLLKYLIIIERVKRVRMVPVPLIFPGARP